MLLCRPVRAVADDLGKLILRLSVAGLMLFHGVSKLRHGVGGIESLLTARGLPSWIAYGVYVGEVLAPLFVLAGWKTRLFAPMIAATMLVALGLRHTEDLARLTKSGAWGVELQMLFLLGAVAIALLGAGRFSVSRGVGRFD